MRSIGRRVADQATIVDQSTHRSGQSDSSGVTKLQSHKHSRKTGLPADTHAVPPPPRPRSPASSVRRVRATLSANAAPPIGSIGIYRGYGGAKKQKNAVFMLFRNKKAPLGGASVCEYRPKMVVHSNDRWVCRRPGRTSHDGFSLNTAPLKGDKTAGKNEGKGSIRREVIEVGGVAYLVTVHGKIGYTESVQDKLLGLLKIHTAVIASGEKTRYNGNGSIGSDLRKERNE